MEGEKYWIGKVEKMCKISKKTLRYYDKIGLLTPCEIVDTTGYRYYDKNNLYTIPVIKYFKQSGFKLETIKKMISNCNYNYVEEQFNKKIQDLEILEREVQLQKKSIVDWYSLVKEARLVVENNLCDVTVKYLEKCKMIFLEQEYNYDYISSIINIDFTNYVENLKNAITGPVMIEFPSFEEKIQGKCKKVKIIQKFLLECSSDRCVDFGGGLVVSCYHIGPYSQINETYKKIKDWIEKYNYTCEARCYERYVLDYWTIKDEKKFVTEIIVKVKNKVF